MKPTDIVQFVAEGPTMKGSLLRINKKGTKMVVAVTLDIEDVLECTPRTYKKGAKNAESTSQSS